MCARGLETRSLLISPFGLQKGSSGDFRLMFGPRGLGSRQSGTKLFTVNCKPSKGDKVVALKAENGEKVMSATKTDKKGNKKDKKDKAPAAKAAAAPVEIQPQGDAVGQPAQAAPAVATDVTPTKRVKKNATQTRIDPSNVESGRLFLKEFYQQCEAHPPRKGYDQHWNSEGFIHSGPATRLPNSGAANMVTLIGDILAKREAAGDKTAGEYLDYCINFLTTHRDALREQREAEILAAAAEIQAKKAS